VVVVARQPVDAAERRQQAAVEVAPRRQQADEVRLQQQENLRRQLRFLRCRQPQMVQPRPVDEVVEAAQRRQQAAVEAVVLPLQVARLLVAALAVEAERQQLQPARRLN
jgi:hypothetical protein